MKEQQTLETKLACSIEMVLMKRQQLETMQLCISGSLQYKSLGLERVIQMVELAPPLGLPFDLRHLQIGCVRSLPWKAAVWWWPGDHRRAMCAPFPPTSCPLWRNVQSHQDDSYTIISY
jgi:hypothetical protein